MTIPRILSALVFLVAASSVAADFAAGWEAHTRGDYATALREWRPLAEQGHPQAQYNLGFMYNKGQGVPEDDGRAVYWYRETALQGFASAQVNLGIMYADGSGVPEDERQAVFWYRKAAAQGNAAAQFLLGHAYATGAGLPQDVLEARFWYRKAAEQGHENAQIDLALSYSLDAPQDLREAVLWLRKAADQGHSEAQFHLGIIYAQGQGVPKDDRQAAVWWRKAAEQGDVQAQIALGTMYIYNEDVPKDMAQAVFWLRKAAEQGDSEAQFHLGLSYLKKDEGVPEDDRQAVLWLRKAAGQEHVAAQSALGNMYLYGKGVPKDMVQAVVWWRRAAEQGDSEAQFNLGVTYAKGRDVPEDDPQAALWYRKAAEQEHVDAQYALGRMYATGEGVPEHYSQAMFWWRKAAEQGDAEAQRGVGMLYATGRGVPEDDVQAYAWTNLSAAQGNEIAVKARTLLRKRMTPVQVAEAQKLSRDLARWIAASSGGSAPAHVSDDFVPSPDSFRDLVRQAQTYLALLGYDPGPADGVSGPRTTAAVRRFQHDLGLTPTGRVSEELLVLLEGAATARNNKPDESVGSGSGFFVGGDGEIVTNHHVVDGCARVSVGRAGTSHDVTVQAVDASVDLALLKAPPDAGQTATFSSSPRASLGQEVMVAGYPLHGLLSRELNVTDGNVSALAGPGDDAKRLQITAPVQQGNSGGPLLDDAGNVIGMVVGKLDAARAAQLTGDIPQNVNFAIKGALVRGFLDIHGVVYRRRTSNARLAPERVAELAHGFTVAVHCWR